MKKIFLTHSIYHVLYSLSIIKEKKEAISYLIIAGKENKQTENLLSSFAKSNELGFQNLKVIYIPIPTPGPLQLSLEAIDNIKILKNIDFDELIIFNEDNLLAIHFAQYFHRKSILVSLAQDGMKAYAKITKKALRYRSLRTLDYYKFCRKNKFNFEPIFVNIAYGELKYIKKLYLSHPKSYENKYNKILKQVDLREDVIKLYEIILDSVNWDFKRKTIFFTSSLLKYNQKQIDVENKILNELSKKFIDYQYIIKLHPRASEKVRTYFNKEFKDWYLIKNQIPAEVYVYFLNECILFSAYSSIALFNKTNYECFEKFWLYPLYGTSLNSLAYTRLSIPDDSIQLVKNWEEFNNISV